jgi:formylmethanofuran dehydrogenase subunit A
MLINMVDGNIVRNSGKQGEELKAADVNGKFPLLDGIDYKSNNAGHSLVYMEV